LIWDADTTEFTVAVVKQRGWIPNDTAEEKPAVLEVRQLLAEKGVCGSRSMFRPGKCSNDGIARGKATMGLFYIEDI